MIQHKLHHEKKWSGADGFSLIEMMVAILILSVGILSLMAMQISTIRTNSLARHLTEGTTLSADQFEEMMTMGYGNAALAPSTTTTSTDGNYTIERVVSAVDTPIKNMKTITITASWTEAGQQRSVSHVYYKAR